MQRIATITASALDGDVVHYAKAGRIAGAVTLCSGRTLAYALTGTRVVTCRSCIRALSAGSITIDPALAEPLAYALTEVAR